MVKRLMALICSATLLTVPGYSEEAVSEPVVAADTGSSERHEEPKREEPKKEESKKEEPKKEESKKEEPKKEEPKKEESKKEESEQEEKREEPRQEESEKEEKREEPKQEESEKEEKREDTSDTKEDGTSEKEETPTKDREEDETEDRKDREEKVSESESSEDREEKENEPAADEEKADEEPEAEEAEPVSTVSIAVRVQDEKDAYRAGEKVRLTAFVRGDALGTVEISWEIATRDSDGDWMTLPHEMTSVLDIEMTEAYDCARVRARITDTADGAVVRDEVSNDIVLRLAEAEAEEPTDEEVIDEEATDEETAEEVTEEEVLEEEAAEEAALPVTSDFSVYARFVNMPDTLIEGTTLTMEAVIEGDVIAPVYQWQKLSGGVWQDIPGANGSTYSFVATVGSAGDKYRVSVEETAMRALSEEELDEALAEEADEDA